MKNLIIDLDGTLTYDDKNVDYEHKRVNYKLVEKLRLYKNMGFKIIIFTSRNMNTYKGDIEKIKALSLPKILKWLDENQIPYDEVIVGKPWCGEEGFYVDDRAIRPCEFTSLSYEELSLLLTKKA